MSRETSALNTAQITYLAFAAIMAAWIGAWLLKINLEQDLSWLTAGLGSFVYWTAAKLIIWIVPAVWLLRKAGRSFREVFGFANWPAWAAWGGGIGLLIALTGIIPNLLQGKAVLPTRLDFALLNVLVIAPTFEELLMRGAIQGNLTECYSLAKANVITSLMFVLLHVPGWYFMGVLTQNLTNPAGGALSIFLVSLGFGYAAHRSRSVMGGVLAHFLNNLF